MPSKIYLLAATALALAPSAAIARDGTPYVGIEGGVMKPKNLKLDYQRAATAIEDGVVLEHKSGFDVDAIAGYDLGFVRVEGEIGWKRASHEDVSINPTVFTSTGRPAIDGRTRVISAMANVLFDLGSDDGLQFYAGGGVGGARFAVDNRITGPGVPLGAGINGDDRSFAWQGIAGVRLPISYNVDLGLKYRYFNSKIELNDNAGAVAERLDGKFRSHSLLASLILNIGSPPAPPVEPVVAPPPPPPPPPPATQTCPDGSVILATDICPAPPPPPPPPPSPERG